MRTYVIELRCDFLDDTKFKYLEAATKTAAKHLYTQALLLQDKRKPQIALRGGDFFSPTEEILLADDIPEAEDTQHDSNNDPTDQDTGPAE